MKKLYSYVLASLFVLVGISAGNSLSAMKQNVALYSNQDTFQGESTKILELRAMYLKEIVALQEQVLEYKKIIDKSAPAQNNHHVNVNQSLVQDMKQSIKSSIKRIVWFLIKWPVILTILSGMGLGLLLGTSYLIGGMPLFLPLWAFVKTAFGLGFSGLKTGIGSIATGIGSRFCSWVPTTNWFGSFVGRFCPARV